MEEACCYGLYLTLVGHRLVEEVKDKSCYWYYDDPLRSAVEVEEYENTSLVSVVVDRSLD